MHQHREKIFEAYQNNHPSVVIYLAPLWLKDNPDDLGILLSYTSMLYQITRYDEAVALLTHAVQRCKSKTGRYLLYTEMGGLERYRGNIAAAEPWYRKAIELHPDEATAYIYLGAAQARQGNYKEAEETHRKATQCSKGCLDEAHHNLGLVLRVQDRLQEAAVHFRKAIELDPNYKDARNALKDVESVLRLHNNESFTLQ